MGMQDRLFSAWSEGKKLTAHFYTKEVSEAEFRAIEAGWTTAPHHGTEVIFPSSHSIAFPMMVLQTLGILRVPMPAAHASDALATFLRFPFRGNALTQLKQGLASLGVTL